MSQTDTKPVIVNSQYMADFNGIILRSRIVIDAKFLSSLSYETYKVNHFRLYSFKLS